MKLDDVKKLHLKRYREEFGYYLVEGEHLVLELQKASLGNPLLRACELYVTPQYQNWHSPFQMHLIGMSHMSQVAETKNPQGIVALVPILPTAPARKGERTIYLHEIQDPGNLGTILRTLAWFGNFRCLVGPESVDPYNPKVIRASAGAIFHVPLEIDVQLQALRDRFPRIACLDLQGEDLRAPQFGKFDCYVFGNEARGIPHEEIASLGAKTYTINGNGAIESLNLAATVNMCVYELNRAAKK